MILLYALAGLFAGSLVNFLADVGPAAWLRDRERARLLPDRRACARCGAATRTGLESALLRFVLRRGRCTQCGRQVPGGGARLPLRPVLVELGAALIFAYLWWYDIDPAPFHKGQPDALRLALHSAWLLVFLLVTVTDLEHRLILDAMMIPAIGAAVLAAFFTPGVYWRDALIGGALGFVFFYLAALLGQALFGAGALGWGDVTLATFIGLITAFPLVLVALVLGILAGGVVTGVLLLTRVRGLRSAVPYGPFLVVGGVAALLWGPQIVVWYFNR
jgi:leader peptidase (prepilin peptidase)/N-methyltransferase